MELEREVVELRTEVKRQAATIRGLEAEAEEQVRLRKGAEDEVDEQRGDIAEQACDQAELEAEVQRLELERDELRGSLVRARSDMAIVERKFDEAERHLADKEQLARRPAMIVAQKERKNRHLQKQLEANSMLIKTIREQLAEARHSADKITSDVAEEETRERLVQRLSSAQRSQAFSEEKCWQLEEQVEDRERALEEAELEAQRLAGRLDEEEEQRLILAEELRQAKATMKVAAEEGHNCERSGDKVNIAKWREQVRQLEAVDPSHVQVCASGTQHHASTKLIIRCGELEVAGKKLLLELDEKDRRMAVQEKALGAVQQRASELQALLDGQLASSHGTSHTDQATAPRAGTSTMAAATHLGALKPQAALWSQPQPHGSRTNIFATAGAAVPGGSTPDAAPRVWISGSGSASGAGSVRESSAEGSGDERRRTAWRRLGNPFAPNRTPLVSRRPAHDTPPSEPDVGGSIAASTGQRCWVGSVDGSSDGGHQDVGSRSGDPTVARWVGSRGRDSESVQHVAMDRSRDAKVDDDRNSESSQQGAKGKSSDGNVVCWVGSVDGSSGRGGGRRFSQPHRSHEEAAEVPRSDVEVAHAQSTDARQWRSSHADAPIASSDFASREWSARDARRESGTSDWSWDNEWAKGGDRIWSDYRQSGSWGGYPQ